MTTYRQPPRGSSLGERGGNDKEPSDADDDDDDRGRGHDVGTSGRASAHGPQNRQYAPRMRAIDLRLERPFGWGVLMLRDASTEDIPLSLSEGPVAAARTALAIRVRHAQDVETDDLHDDEVIPPFVVGVSVEEGPSPDAGLAFDGVLQVPSGVLVVGDAEREHRLGVRPGGYRIQVSLDDANYAEDVRIALTWTGM